MNEIRVGDRIAAAVKFRNTSELRVGVVEKIHAATPNVPVRYTIREDSGLCTVVSSRRSIAIERDKYHTMDELYHYRALYNAAAARAWHNMGISVVKSRRHHDGEMWPGMFIVTALLPTGQVSNHYFDDLWDLFDIPEAHIAPAYDGHTPEIAAARLEAWLMQAGR